MTRTQERLHIEVMGADGRLNEVLVRNLSQWGYETTVWGRQEPAVGEQAVPADLLIVDLDGLEQELLTGGEDADAPGALVRPVARLTIALGSHRLRRKTLEALETVLFLSKPFDMGVLREYLVTLGRVLAEVAQPQEPPAVDRQVRVLVADDDSRLTEWASTVLSRNGRYIARAAHDGIEVLEQCMAWEPDCLVMDMMMPRMNGYQVLRCLRARPRLTRLPVVVLSALAEVEVRAEELRQPMLAVLKKPLRSADLLAGVEQVLDMRLVEGSRGPLEVG
jgi:CheY-like chemotaxis protein